MRPRQRCVRVAMPRRRGATDGQRVGQRRQPVGRAGGARRRRPCRPGCRGGRPAAPTSSTSPRRASSRGSGSAWASSTTPVGAAAPRGSTPGSASDRPQPVQRARAGRRTSGGQQRSGRRASPPASPRRGQVPGQGDVFDHVPRPPASRPPASTSARALERHALAVGHRADRAAHGAAALGRAEAVDERGQHRGVQPLRTRASGSEPAADGDEVAAVGDAPGPPARRAARARVGCRRRGSPPSRRSAARRPCCERPRLARPAGGQRCARVTTRAPAARGDVGRGVGALVVDHDHLGDAGRADDGVEQRADASGLVARRDHHA